ncbi:MAG: glycosyltransferase family 2 protein [Actinomycetes bacterium]
MLGSSSGDDLVCVVTTVKDTPENLDRFVERNLAGGADHLFVYVDDADESTYQRLGKKAHVTAVRTGAGYWHGQRPRSLNKRQWVNANLTNVLLTAFPEVRWLFHLDGDEELDLDRDALLALPPEIRAVRLGTLESVASASSGRSPALFKRELLPGELALLTTLGVISRPSNKVYFHGHTSGKSGIRPALDLRLGVHNVETTDRVEVEPFRADWLHVLHHDSWSPEEFLRKWTEHLNPDNTASFRNRKERLRAGLGTLAGLDIDESLRTELLREIYRRNVADEVELLGKLGFLVQPERTRHQHRPRGFSRATRKNLDHRLQRLRQLDKHAFFDRNAYAPRQVVATLLAEATSGSVQERLLACSTQRDAAEGRPT